MLSIARRSANVQCFELCYVFLQIDIMRLLMKIFISNRSTVPPVVYYSKNADGKIRRYCFYPPLGETVIRIELGDQCLGVSAPDRFQNVDIRPYDGDDQSDSEDITDPNTIMNLPIIEEPVDLISLTGMQNEKTDNTNDEVRSTSENEPEILLHSDNSNVGKGKQLMKRPMMQRINDSDLMSHDVLPLPLTVDVNMCHSLRFWLAVKAIREHKQNGIEPNKTKICNLFGVLRPNVNKILKSKQTHVDFDGLSPGERNVRTRERLLSLYQSK